jgi:hypothetical protein
MRPLTRATGRVRRFYWRWLRTRRAYHRHITLLEWQWSAKHLSAAEADELTDHLKGWVPW